MNLLKTWKEKLLNCDVSNMSYTIIIPARYSSKRLPGKPLRLIGDIPMIQHVWNRASESGARRIVIATDDSRIYDTCISFGAECQMTSSDHSSGSDRIMEVCRAYKLLDSEVVVNLQGDEPFMSPLLIDQLVENKESHAEFGVATMCEEIIDPDLLTEPSVVKVLFDSEGKALSFSRISDPIHRAGLLGYKHLGIYAYSVAILKKFISWPIAKEEKKLSLEQLRFMSNGVNIHVGLTQYQTGIGVDTASDLQHANKLLEDE